MSAALAVMVGASASAASAAAIPGATYIGTAADGATIQLTISSGGTSVNSYRILGIVGTDANGRQCQDTVSIGPGGWSGATITGAGFQDSFASSFSINGAFSGQNVSGSFNVDEPVEGTGTGCSTGPVSWSASTTSTSSGGSGSGSGTTTGKKKPRIRVRLSVRRRAHRLLDGHVRSSTAACRARRTVYLWVKHRRLGSSRANRTGAFSFHERARWRGRAVHVTVAALNTRAATCEPGASSAIRA